MASLFDGIGGFPLGASRYGITPVWASEIEAFPIKVTQQRFPEMLQMGDITKLDCSKLPSVDVITGGSPCQDLSVAGLRAGIGGARSGLFMEQVRVTKEMRKESERRGTDDFIRPRYMLWENVPGAFSSGDGEDFRIVLEEIVRIADDRLSVPRPASRGSRHAGGVWKSAGCVLGDKFSVAWRVLDARYRLPQRRKRIYLVADFGGFTAPKILFEQDRLFGDSAESGGTRQGTAADAESRADDSGESDGGAISSWHINQRNDRRVAGDKIRGIVEPLRLNNSEEQMQTFIASEPCLNSWDTQHNRIFTGNGVSPTLSGANEGRNPAGLLLAAGVITKGNGDVIVTPESHTSLTRGGGQAGQGYACVMTAGFSAGASPKAAGIGYHEEEAPTLRGSGSGNMMPSVLCVNDQGGERIDVSEETSGTLRAQMKGHPPLVLATQQGGAEIGEDFCPTITASAGMSGNNQPVLFENNGADARYNGPLDYSPTVTRRYGSGGNNTALVALEPETYCIAGNTIDRQPGNGGNGLGCQPGVAYTLTAMDKHAVFNRQGYSAFSDESDVAATETAHQAKDATDLVVFGQSQYSNYSEEADSGCSTLRASGGTNGGGSENLVREKLSNAEADAPRLIRRLTPLECERLQGFPDSWTDIPGASDSARYKALGNSVAIPCVEFVMRGVAYYLRKIYYGTEDTNYD
jgi:DNA (cytosine-5)-methyltransferase 1